MSHSKDWLRRGGFWLWTFFEKNVKKKDSCCFQNLEIPSPATLKGVRNAVKRWGNQNENILRCVKTSDIPDLEASLDIFFFQIDLPSSSLRGILQVWMQQGRQTIAETISNIDVFLGGRGQTWLIMASARTCHFKIISSRHSLSRFFAVIKLFCSFKG